MLAPAAADVARAVPEERRRRPPIMVLNELRATVAQIERKHAGFSDEARPLPFGAAPLDAVLGGGLARGALHEIVAAGEAQSAAAAGIALMLAARTAADRPVLFVGEDMAAHESGVLYGPGLDEIGLAPERLILVRAARRTDALWAMEEGLRCRALAAVIGEFRAAEAIDDVAVRRLSLAAGKQQALGFILHPCAAAPLPVSTRFVVASAASAPATGIGSPAFHVDLVRNRFGQTGSWMLEWNSGRFELAATRGESVAAAARDRSRHARAA